MALEVLTVLLPILLCISVRSSYSIHLSFFYYLHRLRMVGNFGQSPKVHINRMIIFLHLFNKSKLNKFLLYTVYTRITQLTLNNLIILFSKLLIRQNVIQKQLPNFQEVWQFGIRYW